MKKRDLHWLIYLVILLGIPLAVRPTGSLTQLGVYALAITVSTLYAWLTIGSIETSLFIYGADDRRGRLGELCPVVPHRHSLHRCDAAHHDALRGAVEAQCAGLPESGRSGAGGGRRPPAQGGQDRPGRADLRRRGGGHVHAALPGGCGRDGVDGRKHEAPGGQPAAGGDHPHSRHPGRDHDQFPLQCGHHGGVLQHRHQRPAPGAAPPGRIRRVHLAAGAVGSMWASTPTPWGRGRSRPRPGGGARW